MTDRSISFTVFGKPEPQGNKTGFVRGGKVVMVEGRRAKSRKAFKDWRGNIQNQADAVIARGYSTFTPFWDCALDVRLNFFLPRPKSLPKKILHPVKKPDLDKLVRAVFDGMTGILFRDDSQIVNLRARKDYSDTPRVEVTISVWEKEGKL